MNIKITRYVEIPDSVYCAQRGKACKALNRDEYKFPENRYARCENFNALICFPDRANYFIKCRDCVDATLNYLHGVTT